jgi:SRSO17 transposase
MDARQIQKLRPMLNKFLRQFGDCFGRSEPVEHLRTYVTGQLSDLPRKSLEPIADAAGEAPRNLQQFLSRHAWDEERMRDILQQRVARHHGHPVSIGVIDDTGHPKKGNKTPGVQRQWCGNTGKVDNCVVTVHLGYTAGSFRCLLDGEPFLPEGWANDRKRCRKAHIPDDVIYRPKWEIALAIWERAVANGVRFEWMTADAGYGEVPSFLFRLDDRGQRYVIEVPCYFTGWLAKPPVLQKQHHHPLSGPPRRYPRLKAKSLPASAVRDLLRHSPILRKVAWEKFYLKDTGKGPMVWEAKAAPFYLKRDGLPTWPHWLIVARNVENHEELKYFISNAPAGTPVEALLHVAFSRWSVERCFEDEKGDLGLSHFEVRTWRSLRRHLILTAVSHWFLAEVHEQWRGEKSGTDGLPGPHGHLGAGPVALDDRAGESDVPGAGGGDPHADPGSSGARPPQPRQNQTPAAA